MSNITFSQPSLNMSFMSDTEIPQSGMNGTVYKLTKLFLDSVLSNKLMPDTFYDGGGASEILDPEYITDYTVDHWQEIMKHNQNLFAAVVFGFMMTIVIWLVGLVWCCSKLCCGRKGGQVNKTDSMCLCVQSVLFGIFLLFGILASAWYLSANDFALDGVDQLNANVDNIFDDSSLYVDNTVEQIHHLTGRNFDELTHEFNVGIDEGGKTFQQLLDTFKVELRFQHLVNVSAFLQLTAANFKNDRKPNMTSALGGIKTSVDGISSEIDSLKNDPDVTAICSALSSCGSFEADLANLNIDPDQIPDSTILDSIQIDTGTLDVISSLSDLLANAEQQLDSFASDFTQDYTGEINKTLEDIGQTIKDEVGVFIEDVEDLDLDQYKQDAQEVVDNTQDLYKYAYYGFLVIGIFVVFVLALYFFGLVFGDCGKVGSSIKQSGGTCLCTGSCIFFLFSAFLWLFVTLFFIVGASVEHLGCRTMADPSNSELGFLLEEVINDAIHESLDNSNLTQVNFTLSTILDECSHNGTSLYSVFHLDMIYNVSTLLDWRTQFDIDIVIGEIKTLVTDSVNDVVQKTTIDLATTDSVNDVAQLFEQVINDVFGVIDPLDPNAIIPDGLLQPISDQLEKLKIDAAGQPAIETKVDNLIAKFQKINDSLEMIKDQVTDAKDYVQDYKSELMFENQPLGDVIVSLLELATNATDFLDNAGRDQILDTLDTVIDTLLHSVDQYVRYAIDYVQSDLGQCKPIHGIYFGVYNSVCNKIVAPLNGIWSGLGLFLILMIPTLIFACLLERMFKRSKPPAYTKDDDIQYELQGYKNAKVQQQQHPASRSNVDSGSINQHQSPPRYVETGFVNPQHQQQSPPIKNSYNTNQQKRHMDSGVVILEYEDRSKPARNYAIPDSYRGSTNM